HAQPPAQLAREVRCDAPRVRRRGAGRTRGEVALVSPTPSFPVGASSDRTAGVSSVAMAGEVSTKGRLEKAALRRMVRGFIVGPMRPPRPTTVEIDLAAAADNVRAVRRMVGPERKIYAVVK